MIVDFMTNKKFQAIIKNYSLDAENWISVVFITQLFFYVPKEVRLNSTHYLIMKTYNKRELQQTAINHSGDINYKDFMKIYRKCASEPYSFLNINVTLLPNNYLRFRKNLLDHL